MQLYRTGIVAALASASAAQFTSVPAAPGATAITVAQDGAGQYNEIGSAIAFAQQNSIPTVTIKAGTYTAPVTIFATATVTVVGETDAADDYKQNKVTINSTLPLKINTNAFKGATFRNINFLNTATSDTAYAVQLAGTSIAFYSCSIVSNGGQPVYASNGVGVIANSYIEGTNRLFSGYPTLYVYGSTISVSQGGNNFITYTKGPALAGKIYNSTLIFDSSSIISKPDTNATLGVYLAAPNNNGSVAVWRNCNIGSFVLPLAIHPSAKTYYSVYGEYETTGDGSYNAKAAARSVYDVLFKAEQMNQFSMLNVFSNAMPPYAASNVDWVDQKVVAAIAASNMAEGGNIAAVQPSTTYASTSTDSATPSPSSVAASTSVIFAVVSNSTTQTIPSSSSAATVLSAVTLPATVSTSTVANTTITAVPAPTATLYVSQSGAGDYTNISAAIAALPNDNKPYVIFIRAGTYEEQLSVTRAGKVILRGETTFENDFSQNKVVVKFSSGRSTKLGQNEQTPVLSVKHQNSDMSGFAVYNIDFVNSFSQTTDTAALAGNFYLYNFAAYGCSFYGYQDTLLVNMNTQLFSNCKIVGSIDFIWGYSKAFFHKCWIETNTPRTCIAAHAKKTPTSPGGFVFDQSYITYTPDQYGNVFGNSFLGRPWNNQSTVVYMNSFIDKHISDAAWSVWSTGSPQTEAVLFGEYNNHGAGAWAAGKARASFATNLNAAQAEAYTLSNWLGDTMSWLDSRAYNLEPSFNLTVSASDDTSPTSTATSTSTPTATAVWGHPTSGVVAPAGAVQVSLNSTITGSFGSLTAALASLPADSSVQIVFVHPGTYIEQVPSISRSGPVQIIGYTTDDPGKDYTLNQVTISFARGLSVSPVPVGHSDAETAVVSTASNKIAFYNLNVINTDNVDGAQPSYVTLAASIYGNQVAFYGCSLIGWQDTLLTGATAGYQYYESTYIDGAIDYIWGYSKAYFKGCTIASKRAGSCITAQSRASATAIGGYIFDQCLFTQAKTATADLSGTVYLGRPYSKFAWVYIKNSFLDKAVHPAGWRIWSTTDPRTDNIYFAEFNNTGPGNWENNAVSRATFQNSTLLTSDQWTLSTVMGGSTSWIDMTHWDSVKTPVPQAYVAPPPVVNGNSKFDGTKPPAGAYIVSKTPVMGAETEVIYATIQDAYNALPVSSSVKPVIFIYAGIYNEKLVLNRSGTTVFQGYTTNTEDYSKNQVTIRYNAAVNTQSSQSNSDGATVYATGNYFEALNINFDNDYGTAADYASLGFAVRSSKFASLYGCQVTGGQDVLLINGNLFAFNSYIAGTVDAIWGSGTAYFLNSTIAPLMNDINLTADKRSSNTTAGGFVFDKCRVVQPSGGAYKDISLGRPWNNFARVAWIYSSLDSSIIPAGWEQWSKSTPNTDGVTFGEYHNSGPGATGTRAPFSQQLSDADVVQFQIEKLFASTAWINFTRVDVVPFVAGSFPALPATETNLSSSTTLATASTASGFVTVTATFFATTIVTLPAVTSAVPFGTRVTLDVGTSGTPLVIFKTVTNAITVSPVLTVTVPNVTKLASSTVTENLSSTVTAAPSIRLVTVKSSSTITTDVPIIGKPTTIRSTVTVLRTVSIAPKPTTHTVTVGSTVTVVSTNLPRSSTFFSTITITPAPKTMTKVQSTQTDLFYFTDVRTRTQKSTTTLSCIPRAQRVRRSEGEFMHPYARRAPVISTQIVQYTITLTRSVAPTITISTPVFTTVTAGTVATLKPVTSTVTAVSTISKPTTITAGGSTISSSVIVTRTLLGTTTLRATTLTSYVTSLEVKTATNTVTVPGNTVTNVVSITSVRTDILPQETFIATSSIKATITRVITEQAGPNVTVWRTASAQQTTVTIASVKTVSKNTTIKTTQYVTSLATKTAKNAPTCT